MLPIALLACASTFPALPADFYTGVQGLIVSASGNYAKNNAQCCAKDAAGCMVQTQARGWDLYQQGSQNRSLTTKDGGMMLTWAAPVHKLMALQPGSAMNSSHKWACGLYCPHKEDFVSAVAIAPEKQPIQSLGNRTIAQPSFAGGVTKNVDGFRWTENLLKILPLNINTMYVDESTSPPKPFKLTSSFTQFIIKVTHEANSTMNKSYIGFDSSFDVASELDVDMDSVRSCKTDKHKCSNARSVMSDPWHDAPNTLAELIGARFGAMSHVERQAVEAGVHSEASLHTDRAAPIFPSSYTATKHFAALTAEGSTFTAEGDACCSEETPECVVESQHSSATEYQDAVSQKVRTEHSDGAVVVDDYVLNQTMAVSVQGGVETCEEYCPIDDIIPRPSARTLPDHTKDRGPKVLDGQHVELYEWSEMILRVIKMSDTKFYARLLPNGTAAPVFESQTVMMLGRKMGTENLTWTSFVPGRPAAGKFVIAGADTCPMSKHCQSPIGAFSTHRRITGQRRAWEVPIFARPTGMHA